MIKRREDSEKNGLAHFMRYWPLVAALIIFAVGYGALQAQTASTSKAAEDNAKLIKVQERRTNDLEKVQIRVDEKLKHIKVAQEGQKKLLEEIAGKLR
jgi:uncharacterized protein HemX